MNYRKLFLALILIFYFVITGKSSYAKFTPFYPREEIFIGKKFENGYRVLSDDLKVIDKVESFPIRQYAKFYSSFSIERPKKCNVKENYYFFSLECVLFYSEEIMKKNPPIVIYNQEDIEEEQIRNSTNPPYYSITSKDLLEPNNYYSEYNEYTMYKFDKSLLKGKDVLNIYYYEYFIVDFATDNTSREVNEKGVNKGIPLTKTFIVLYLRSSHLDPMIRVVLEQYNPSFTSTEYYYTLSEHKIRLFKSNKSTLKNAFGVSEELDKEYQDLQKNNKKRDIAETDILIENLKDSYKYNLYKIVYYEY